MEKYQTFQSRDDIKTKCEELNHITKNMLQISQAFYNELNDQKSWWEHLLGLKECDSFNQVQKLRRILCHVALRMKNLRYHVDLNNQINQGDSSIRGQENAFIKKFPNNNYTNENIGQDHGKQLCAIQYMLPLVLRSLKSRIKK